MLCYSVKLQIFLTTFIWRRETSIERNNWRRQKRAHEHAKHLRQTNTLYKSTLDSCLTTDQNRKGERIWTVPSQVQDTQLRTDQRKVPRQRTCKHISKFQIFGDQLTNRYFMREEIKWKLNLGFVLKFAPVSAACPSAIQKHSTK